jgi:hypothetical protein
MPDLGFADEATAFVHWLVERLRECEGKQDGEPLQTMDRLDGSPDLPEGPSTASRATADPRPCASGTAPPTSSSSISTERLSWPVSQGRETGQ